MEKCIEDVRKFLLDNKLCNNREKTEFMLIGGPQQLCKMQINSNEVQSIAINAAHKVKNLGVMFDKSMSMESHANQ